MKKTYACNYDIIRNHTTTKHTLFVEATNLKEARQEFNKDWFKTDSRTPHRFHIDIHPFVKTSMTEYIVSMLNNSMENDAEYWTNEFCCTPKEIVQDFGFGYYANDEAQRIFYLSGGDIVRVPIDKSKLINKIIQAQTKEEIRNLIDWIYRKSEEA